MDRMFDNGDNFDFQQELYEHAEFLKDINYMHIGQESNKLLVRLIPHSVRMLMISKQMNI